jgi:hypothetical protein
MLATLDRLLNGANKLARLIGAALSTRMRMLRCTQLKECCVCGRRMRPKVQVDISTSAKAAYYPFMLIHVSMAYSSINRVD